MRMRKILFRGKPVDRFSDFFSVRKECNKDGFVQGSLIQCSNRTYICIWAACSHTTYINNVTATMVEVIPESVGQWTGFKDKNNKRIFEGDIMRNNGNVVEYCNGSFCINGDRSIAYWTGTEIIGNIHDNPELLK